MKSLFNLAGVAVTIVCLIVIIIGLVNAEPVTWGIGLGVFVVFVGIGVVSQIKDKKG